VDDVAYHKHGSERLCSEEYEPWPEHQVIEFLECQLGLSKRTRITGRVVTHHHQAFYFWKYLIRRGKLTTPFDIVHADAHADLGMGDASWPYIMGELLHGKLPDRAKPRRGGKTGIGPGNYLAFAVACRWVRTLTYVQHREGGNDLPRIHFKNFRENSGFIELKRCRPGFELDCPWCRDYEECQVIEVEPAVPFRKVPDNEYFSKAAFDLIVLSKSPAFTPATCDPLIEIVREYMFEI